MKISVIDGFENDFARETSARLKAYNTGQGYSTTENHITVAAHNAQGQFLGGATVYLKWEWAFVDHLYVETRRQGTGRAIMQQVEDVARQHGKHGVYLYTGAFQTPAFYEALGYVESGRIPAFVGPHDEILYVKKLGIKP